MRDASRWAVVDACARRFVRPGVLVGEEQERDEQRTSETQRLTRMQTISLLSPLDHHVKRQSLLHLLPSQTSIPIHLPWRQLSLSNDLVPLPLINPDRVRHSRFQEQRESLEPLCSVPQEVPRDALLLMLDVRRNKREVRRVERTSSIPFGRKRLFRQPLDLRFEVVDSAVACETPA